MKTKFRKVKDQQTRRIKTVEETTETIEHRCTEACFQLERRPRPKNLSRVNLGYVYVDPLGRCYSKRVFDEWMEVLGLSFAIVEGRFALMWEPAEQLHLHSPGGKTIGKIVNEREIRTDETYHFMEAAKKAKRKGLKLVETERCFGVIARDVIGLAPRRKRQPNGLGRGAPGRPRSSFSKEVVRLIAEGLTERAAVEAMVNWSRDNGRPVAGPYKVSISQRVRRWYKQKNTIRK